MCYGKDNVALYASPNECVCPLHLNKISLNQSATTNCHIGYISNYHFLLYLRLCTSNILPSSHYFLILIYQLYFPFHPFDILSS